MCVVLSWNSVYAKNNLRKHAFFVYCLQAKFTVTKSEDEDSSKDAHIIECQGIGLLNTNL